MKLDIAVIMIAIFTVACSDGVKPSRTYEKGSGDSATTAEAVAEGEDSDSSSPAKNGPPAVDASSDQSTGADIKSNKEPQAIDKKKLSADLSFYISLSEVIGTIDLATDEITSYEIDTTDAK